MNEKVEASADHSPDPLRDPSRFAFQLLRKNIATSSLDAKWKEACARVMAASVPDDLQLLHALVGLPKNAPDKT